MRISFLGGRTFLSALGVLIILTCIPEVACSQPALQWERFYHIPQYQTNQTCWNMIKTREGGYALCGDFNTDLDTSSLDGFLVVTDSIGTPILQRRYGNRAAEWFTAITELPDSGFLCVGQANNSALAIRTDAAGNMVWYRTFDDYGYGQLGGVIEMEDGNYLLAGIIYVNGFDCWFLKINPAGNVLLSRSYGTPSRQRCGDLIRTHDGNYVALGTSNVGGDHGYDAMVFKITADGDSVWMKTFGTDQYDGLLDVKELPDGGLIAGGMCQIKLDRFSGILC